MAYEVFFPPYIALELFSKRKNILCEENRNWWDIIISLQVLNQLGLSYILKVKKKLVNPYLYTSRPTHGLPQNAENSVFVFVIGGWWKQLLYLPFLSRKKRQTFSMAGL